jgi:hypothetical protein
MYFKKNCKFNAKLTWQIILKQLKFIGIYLITNMMFYLKSSPEGQNNVFFLFRVNSWMSLDSKLKTLLWPLGLDPPN